MFDTQPIRQYPGLDHVVKVDCYPKEAAIKDNAPSSIDLSRNFILNHSHLSYSALATQMAASPLYTPLDPSREEIRLLEIVSTDEPIACRMLTASLQVPARCPAFCAISYVWGDLDATEIITVDGAERHITPSLHSALLCSYYHWQESFPDRWVSSCLLWADALCINQDDLQEKSSQIPLMGKIYSVAEMTFCCLDYDAPASRIGLAFTLLKEIREGLKYTDYDVDGWDDQPQTVNLDWLVSNPTIREHCTGTGLWLTEVRAPANEAIVAISDLAYWTRLWIFQEMVLSRDPLLVFGSQSMKLYDFVHVAIWGSVTSRLPAPRNLHVGFRNGLRRLSKPQTTHLVPLLARTRKKRQSLEPGSWDYEMQNYTLHAHAFGCACLEASEPKDHVYALIGVVGLDTKPDYSSSKSVSSVYIDLCADLLTSCARVRSSASEEVSSRTKDQPLSFLRYAGIESYAIDGESDGLPSWVPNFPQMHKRHLPTRLSSADIHLSNPEGGHYIVTDETDWSEKIRIQGNALQVPGVLLTSLAAISPAVTSEPGTSRPFGSFIFKTISDLQGSNSTRHPLILLANAFCVSELGDNIWESPDVLRLIQIMQYLGLGVEDNPRADNSDDLEPGSFRSTTNDGTLGSPFLSRMGISQAVIEEAMSGPDAAAARTFIQSVNDNLGHYFADEDYDYSRSIILAASQLTTRQDRLSKTADNQFAIVPSCAAIGDQVALLLGHEGFSLVRRVDGHYVYVGACRISTKLRVALEEVRAGTIEVEMLELR